MTWLRRTSDGVELVVRVQPGARATEVVGLQGDALKVRVAAPPVDGKANGALVGFLAGRLRLPRRGIEIVAGTASRTKRVRLTGVTVEEARGRLTAPDRS